MDHIVCGGCRTLLMYARGAGSVRCLHCYTVTMTANRVSTVRCSCCNTQLMYPSGAPSVKCAICQFTNSVGNSYSMPPPPGHVSSTMQPIPHSGSKVVVIENPTSFDGHGNPVNNFVVGITTKERSD